MTVMGGAVTVQHRPSDRVYMMIFDIVRSIKHMVSVDSTLLRGHRLSIRCYYLPNYILYAVGVLTYEIFISYKYRMRIYEISNDLHVSYTDKA